MAEPANGALSQNRVSLRIWFQPRSPPEHNERHGEDMDLLDRVAAGSDFDADPGPVLQRSLFHVAGVCPCHNLTFLCC